MSLNEESESFKSEILLDTQFLEQEVCLTWRISNYSNVFGPVSADFFIKSSAKKWTLAHHLRSSIQLSRFRGVDEFVKLYIKYCLKSRLKIYQGEMCHIFKYGYNEVSLINLGKGEMPLEFENDVFKFHIKMKFVGPAVSKFLQSNNIQQPNLAKLSDDFRQLLNNRDHCDVTIAAGSKKLPVHKAVLCARSTIFDRMFKNDMLECNSQLIKLDDVDYDTLEHFVTFLYTGDFVIISVEQAMDLYYVADKYEVRDLLEKCSLYLQFNLSVTEACTIFEFAELHRDDKLKSAVNFFIQMHESEVKATANWNNLVQNNPKLALDVFK